MDPLPKINPRRSCRIKIHPLEMEKRRVISKPKKIIDGSDLKQVHSYYLDKRVKRLPPSLETIFEEPKESKNEILFMSLKKFNRCLNFDKTSSKLKVKKRQLKAKKYFSKKKNKKVTLDLLMKTLSLIEGENFESLQVNIVEDINKKQLST